MVANGLVNGGYLDYTEIIDLSGDCLASLPNYPKELFDTTGQFFNNSVIICGGVYFEIDNGYKYTSECFSLRKNAVFERFTPMKEARGLAKSIVTQGGVWITGGEGGNGYLISSTEYIPKSSKPQNPKTPTQRVVVVWV